MFTKVTLIFFISQGGDMFTINRQNGEITLKKHLDYEKTTFYQYTVIAKAS